MNFRNNSMVFLSFVFSSFLKIVVSDVLIFNWHWHFRPSWRKWPENNPMWTKLPRPTREERLILPHYSPIFQSWIRDEQEVSSGQFLTWLKPRKLVLSCRLKFQSSWWFYELLSVIKGFLERIHGLKYCSSLFKNKEKDISRSLCVVLFAWRLSFRLARRNWKKICNKNRNHHPLLLLLCK